MGSVMRNCGQACFLGNKNICAVTRNRWRFEEVGNIYGEETGWHFRTCTMCVSAACGCLLCVCVGGDSDV